MAAPADPESLLEGSYYRVLDIVAEPLSFYDDDVAAVMDDENLGVVETARRERSWFPEREFGLFVEGWSGVAYRLEAVEMAAQSLSTSEHPGEHDLFAFFSNAVAAIESYTFAVYCAAAMLDSRSFPTRDPSALRKINPRSTLAAFEKSHPAASITRLLRDLLGSNEYLVIHQVRNTLSHRASPTQLTRRDEAWPVDWLTGRHGGPDIELTPELIRLLADWLSAKLGVLGVGLEHFAKDRWAARGRSRSSS